MVHALSGETSSTFLNFLYNQVKKNSWEGSCSYLFEIAARCIWNSAIKFKLESAFHIIFKLTSLKFTSFSKVNKGTARHMASISLRFVGFCCKSIVGVRGDASKIVLFQISYECTVHHIGHKILSRAVFMVELFLQKILYSSDPFVGHQWLDPICYWTTQLRFLLAAVTCVTTRRCKRYRWHYPQYQNAREMVPFPIFSLISWETRIAEGQVCIQRTARTKQASAWIQSKFVILQPLTILSTRRLLFKSWLSSPTFSLPIHTSLLMNLHTL